MIERVKRIPFFGYERILDWREMKGRSGTRDRQEKVESKTYREG